MVALNVTFHLLVLVLSLAILGKSANFLMTSVTRIGLLLRLSQFLTGFILLGIATSAPEISVAITSSLANSPQLSLGNLLGANVVLLTFITGLAAIFAKGIEIKKELTQSSRLIQIALLIAAPIPLLVDSTLSRLDGVFLLFLYVMYIVYVYRTRPNQSQPLTEELMNYKIINTLILCVTGLLGLYLSSKAVVFSSLQIANLLNIPSVEIGLLVLSLGTNLPEITITLAAIKKHHTDLVFGDVLGSAASNSLIIASIGIISPFNLSSWTAYETTTVFLLLALTCFIVMTKTKKRLSPNEGLILFVVYAAYVTTQILTTYFRL